MWPSRSRWTRRTTSASKPQPIMMANSRPEALPASCWIDRAGGDDLGQIFGLAWHIEIPGQQIFGAQGEQGDGNARRRCG